MIELLEFIFGGTVLWGIPRFVGVLILIFVVTGWMSAFAKWVRKK